MYTILGLIGLVIVVVVLFVNFYPSFGEKPEGKRLERIKTAENYSVNRFKNPGTVKEDFSWGDYKKMISKMLKGNPNKKPDHSLPSIKWSESQVDALSDTVTTAVWYGHSAFYLKMNGMNILLDPMFGDYPAPAPYLINKRFDYQLPIEIEDLPEIDVIVFSHDHYDHLDYGSVLKLKDKTKMFLVPLGLGAHLESWGVSPDKIKELYWYEEATIDKIKFTCTPAQHFSGRGIGDKFQTLWCSWVLDGQHNIYFSGDSGYFDGFKEIGTKFGPFDICFVECGQYDPLWADIHMFPEETAQAHLDLKGKLLVPIHWGGFTLSNHDWDDPIKRVLKASKEKNITLITPKIGQAIVLDDTSAVFEEWWKVN